MKKFLIIVSLIIFYFTAVYSENNTKTEIFSEFKNKNSKIFINSDQLEKNAYKLWDLYQDGVQAENNTDTLLAIQKYKEFLSIGPRPADLNAVELDLLCRLIGIADSKNDFEGICNYCKRAVSFPKEIQEENSNMAWVYLMYIYSLNMLNRCNNIDDLLDKASFYNEKTYKPIEKNYYDISLQGITAYLNMNELNKAINLFENLNNLNSTFGNHIVDEELNYTYGFIERYDYPWPNKEEFVEYISKSMIELMMFYSIIEKDELNNLYTLLVSQIHNYLNYNYFDINKVEDETIWTRLIAWYSLLVNGILKGQNLNNREAFAYNYILTSKNFLSWHSNNTLKKEITWEEIKRNLNTDEIAIEIYPYSAEIFIVKNNYEGPKALSIDSLMLNEFKILNINDAIEINNFYKKEGILSKLVSSLDPYIKDCKRIYIAASHFMTQFNYGAIYYNNKRLDDQFDVIQMITTADILKYKLESNKVNYDSMVLFGGIDYDIDCTTDYELNGNETKWAYSENIPSQMRGGYGYLPYTLKEVQDISVICEKYNISFALYAGSDASEESVKNFICGNSAILHIATHSFLLPTYVYKENRNLNSVKKSTRLGTIMSNTGMLFSGVNQFLKNGNFQYNDGILTAKEISELDFSEVKLAVLSSCSTALGDLTNINGISYGLASALKDSGINEIMVTLWDVPDQTTSAFMKIFYENLLQGGRTVQESLKLAQQSMRDSGYFDPFYWAAFVILN